MFRASSIKTGFANILGWRQDYDPSKQIDTTLVPSDSGQYYQETHPLLTLDNIRAIAPNFEDIDYDAWVITTNYLIGAKIEYSGVNYKALTDNLGAQPDISATDWKVADDFSDWLTEKTEASNLNALQTIFTNKLANKTAKNIFKQKALFDGVGNIKDLITSTSNLVGFEIAPIRSLGTTVKIESIGLQFKGTGNITLYLFHSSRNVPLKTIIATRTRDSGMEWFLQDDLYLPYLDDSKDAGGKWYLVYEQDETTGQEAINKLRHWDKVPCISCNNYDTMSYNYWSKYINVLPFKADSLGGTYEMWDIDNNIHTYETNYGINLKLSVECDVTDVFLDNKLNFQTVMGLQMAHDMIREFVYNPSFNVNRTNQNFSRTDLLYELNGNPADFVNSVTYKLRKAYEAVSVDLTNMSRDCFVCKFKVKRKTI